MPYIRIKYILYKFLNMLACKSLRKDISLPLLTVAGGVVLKPKSIHFDFSSRLTHLGDRLFFFPLIVFLVNNGYRVTLSSEDLVTNKLLKSIYGFEVPNVSCLAPHNFAVIPQPSYLSLRDRYKNLLVVNFSDTKVHSRIAQSLVSSFCKMFGISLGFFNLASPLTSQDNPDFLEDNCRYFLFSNYIDSGFFRRWFLNEDRLYKKCCALKAQGFKILHVGTSGDKSSDNRFYPFVDLDLRGRLDLAQLVELAKSTLVEGAVTYDNAIMHLCGFYNKTAYVLFRGRFTKISRDHHYRYVNNTFFSDVTKLIYI